MQVEATDEDSQQNGQIEYSLYYPKGEARRAFHIDAASGALMASPYVEFDREERPFEDVTVKVYRLLLFAASIWSWVLEGGIFPR